MTEGEPGWNDYNPDPDPKFLAAGFRVADLGRLIDLQNWADAGRGEQNWQRAGSPRGSA